MTEKLASFIKRNIDTAAEILALTDDEKRVYEMGVRNVVQGGFPLAAHEARSLRSYYKAGEEDGEYFKKK